MKSMRSMFLLTLIVGTCFATGQRTPPTTRPPNPDAPAVVLAKLCQSTVNAEFSLCAGTMSGFEKMLDAVDTRRGMREICFPQGVPGGQDGDLRKAFIQYVEGHPEKLDLHIGQVAYLAFLDAFPCKK